MTDERRRTARLECDLAGLWRRGGRSSIVRVRSVNVHGFLIDTVEPVPPNYLLDLVLFLPTGAISMLAVARRAEANGIAATIHAIDDPDGQRLVAFYWSLRNRTRERMPA